MSNAPARTRYLLVERESRPNVEGMELPTLLATSAQLLHIVALTLRELQEVLIEKEKVAIMPGFTYGEEGRGFLRLNVGCSRSKVEAGMDKLINGILFLQGNNGS